MFARAASRTLQAASPLKLTARRYSTAPGGGGSSAPMIGAAALAAGAGAYYIYSNASITKEVAAKAPAAAAAVADAATSSAATFTGGKQGWVPLEVEKVDTLNHNVKLVRFKLPEAGQVSGMEAASALLTKFKPEGAEKPVIRPYTAVSDDDAKGHLDLLVKKYEGGAMSSHIHSLQPGDKLDVKGPIVKYKWAPNKHEEIALVAGGTGITPMYQLIKAIFTSPQAATDKTKVTLVFGNISEKDILLHKELRDIENKYPQRFRAFYVLEKPEDEAAFAKTAGTKGYITKDLLKQVLPEPKNGDKIKVFVCGPPGLMNAVSGNKNSPSDQGDLTGALQELGYAKDQVLKL